MIESYSIIMINSIDSISEYRDRIF